MNFIDYDSLVIFISGLLTGMFGSIDERATADYRSGGYYRIGIGGQYISNQSRAMDFNAYSGVLSMDMRGIMRERAQAVLSGQFSYGSLNPSNNDILQNGRNVSFNFTSKLGINVATKANPLYVNAFYLRDSFYGADRSGLGENGSNQRIGWDLGIAGLEIEGRYKATQSVYVEYGLGYGYVFTKNGYAGKSNEKLNVGNSYAIIASLGYSQDISPKILYFVKANAKYFNLGRFYNNNVEHYPKSQLYTIGLEVGLGF